MSRDDLSTGGIELFWPFCAKVIRDIIEKRKNREYNEAGEELEDAGDKVKAGAKAVANKVEDPDKDLDSEYQKEKTEEKMD